MELVLIDNLNPGMIVGRDVFPTENKVVALLKEDAVLDVGTITRLRNRGVRAVIVKDRFDPPAQKPQRRISTPGGDIYVPYVEPVITDALKVDALTNLEKLFTTITIDEGDIHESSTQVVKHLETIVQQLVDSLEQDRGTLVNINNLKSFDEYTYHHSLSVAVLSVAIGQYMGVGEERLNALGRCAIMHDIGKTSVPIEVIHKPAKLDERELGLIRTHSPAGYDYLFRKGIGDLEMWRGVLHHHEKFDGTGYPYGLAGNNIPVWSRVITVADVYDALTSSRPYRSPMQPTDAIEYVMGGIGTSFDYDMAAAFLNKVEMYPLGNAVRLSNGQTAVVVDNENTMRPVVKIADTGEVLDLFRDKQCRNLVITELFSSGEAPFEPAGGSGT